MCQWKPPKKLNRLVIKVGSRLLVSGKEGLDSHFISQLAKDIISSEIPYVTIVSSGAVAAGMGQVGIKEIPSNIPAKQALAAIGQSHLIRNYEKVFEKWEKKVAQILLTGDDLSIRNRFLNAVNTFEKLFAMGVIPIVNENDTITVDEIKFGDNDTLSAKVSVLVDADLLIILTDVDGVYDKNPDRFQDAKLITCIKNIDKKYVEQFSGDTPGKLGTGGIYTKLLAAYEASLKGIPTIIANGKKEDIIKRILSGDLSGTTILPRKKKLKAKKVWMAIMSRPKGKLIIDTGAVNALLKGKSLLPSGIKEASGNFSRGDTVEIVSEEGREIAKGLVEYNVNEIQKIKGHKSAEIEKLLGYIFTEEVIHRDKMVLTYGVT